MHVYNVNAPYEAYKAFDHLVRNSKLRDVVGTIILSVDPANLELVAGMRTGDVITPHVIASARTAESLFAQVLLVLSSLL